MLVEVLSTHVFGGRAANGEVKVRVPQTVLELRENGSQHPGSVCDLSRTNIAEAGHVPAQVNGSTERGRRGVELQGNKVLGQEEHPLPVRNFLFQGRAKHALTVFTIVIQGLLETLPHRMGDDWSGDHLGVGLLQAGAGVGTVVVENSDVGNAMIEAQCIVARLVDAQDVGHVRI